MYYIESKPNVVESYGNPQSARWEGALALPEELLAPYIAARGFVRVTVEDRILEETDELWPTVTSVEVNQEALEAYLKKYPDVEPVPGPTDQERLEAQVTYTAMITDTLFPGGLV